jgi:hypothetical protein
VAVQNVEYLDDGIRRYRIILSFGEVRQKENSIVITDSQQASLEFKYQSTINDVIYDLQALIVLLKSSMI